MAVTRVKLTPPPGTTGRYAVAAPYDAMINPGEIYECIAIRQFEDFEQLGEDVFARYYEAVNLTQADYSSDKRLGANIITLATISGNYYFIPDTFILEFPNMGAVVYNRVVLALDLGPIPSSLDLTFLKQQISSVVTDTIGLTANREPIVSLAIAPTRNAITPQEHEVMEAARIASIANRTTDRAKLIVVENQNIELHAKIAVLEQYIRDHPAP